MARDRTLIARCRRGRLLDVCFILKIQHCLIIEELNHTPFQASYYPGIDRGLAYASILIKVVKK